MDKKNDFIADGVPPLVAYKELTLNLENQGYEGAAIISRILYQITRGLVKGGII